MEWTKSDKSGVLKRESGVTSFDVSKAEKMYDLTSLDGLSAAKRDGVRIHQDAPGPKQLRKMVNGQVLMNMKTEQGNKDLALLEVKCYPGFHLNYKVKVFHPKEDLPLMGGEVSGKFEGSKGSKESLMFLHVASGTIRMKSDSAFQYHKTWEKLGGTAAADAYFKTQDDAEDARLLQTTPCNASKQQDAAEICRKAGLKDEDSLTFAECVFDVCRAGEEAVPELAEISQHMK